MSLVQRVKFKFSQIWAIFILIFAIVLNHIEVKQIFGFLETPDSFLLHKKPTALKSSKHFRGYLIIDKKAVITDI